MLSRQNIRVSTPRLLIALGVLLSFFAIDDARGQLVLDALKDNTLYEDSQGDLSNGMGEHFFAGRTNQGGAVAIRRGLVAFDLSVIPSGSTITNATLTLRMSRTQAGNEPVSLHVLLADWGEEASQADGNEGGGAPAAPDDATWQHTFYDTDFWTNDGGDFVGSASATVSVGGNGFYDWTSAQMIADVQAWVDNPATNYGWILIGDESTLQTVKRFDSLQNANESRRPKLTVTFTPPPDFGACCFENGDCLELTSTDCTSQGGDYQGNGTDCEPNMCPQPTGACCLAGETCMELTEAECMNQGGVYQGDESDCTPNPCLAPTGACCFEDGSCSVLSETNCANQGGTYQGDDTDCEPNMCPQPTGACCSSGAACEVLTADECDSQGGVYQGDATVCTPNSCPLNLEPFVDPLPIPGVAQPVVGVPGGEAQYEITMSQFQQQLHRDLQPTTVWGYNGTYPGPTIEAGMNLPVTVRWINNILDEQGQPRTDHYLNVDLCPHGAENEAKTVVHLHGGHVAPEFDGYPESTFLPTEEEVYLYPNNQLPATLWYHDHALGITRLNVYMGLAGFYLIRDDFEQSLDLPTGEFEIPIVIQDRSFNIDGSWMYPSQWQDHFFGDTILVNGKVWPYLNVKQGKYRFRILNGSNSRVYTLALSNGASFDLIGIGGGLLETPLTLTEITLAGAERADIVMDFESYPPGTEIILTNSAPAPFPGDPGAGVIPEITKFVVQDETGYTTPLPAELRPLEVLDEEDAVQFREFVLRKQSDPCSGSIWLINGLLWDDITEFVTEGTTEVWSFVNRSGMMHPMHIHLVMFQVLDRQAFEVIDDEIVPVGDPIPPLPEEIGWKDTARVNPQEITRVIARYENFTGLYPYHCHILEHEDHEMMRQFRVVPTCPWDLNEDNVVAIDDLLMLLAAWGPCADCKVCPQDFNHDCAVAIDDLLTMLAAWGACP